MFASREYLVRLAIRGGLARLSLFFSMYCLYMVFILFLLMYSTHMMRVVIDIVEPM
jgi:hypothetical protein